MLIPDVSPDPLVVLQSACDDSHILLMTIAGELESPVKGVHYLAPSLNVHKLTGVLGEADYFLNKIGALYIFTEG